MVEQKHPVLSIRQQCQLLNFPRSDYYTDKKLLDKIDEIYLDLPEYGSRRMMKALRKEGYSVGRSLRNSPAMGEKKLCLSQKNRITL